MPLKSHCKHGHEISVVVADPLLVDVAKFRRFLAEIVPPLQGAEQQVPSDAFMLDLGAALRYLLRLHHDRFTGQMMLTFDCKDGGIAMIQKSEKTKLT